MKLLSPRGAALGALCAALLSLAWLLSPSLLGAEWWLFDRLSVQLARERRPDPRILLVTVSDAAARALGPDFGRPQEYSREVYARVVDELLRNGAKVVAIDILFGEANEAAPDGDRALAAALAGKPVILGAQTNDPSARTITNASTAWRDKLWSIANAKTPAYALVPPHDPFREAAGIGTIRLGTSRDSAKVHRYPLADRVESGYVPS
ncbi:MAG TPA: CHASE2 domain-containing protein, partial [Thermoanaerobaculia bacterium]